MTFAQLIPLLVALLSFFASKKSGASTTEAALLGLTAGGLTYAALSETDWGNTNVFDFDSDSSKAAEKISADKATELIASGQMTDTGTKENGKTVYLYDGMRYVLEDDGSATGITTVTKYVTKTAADGTTNTSAETTTQTAIKTIGSTLSSWGGYGTSAVLATGKAVTSSGEEQTKWLLIAGAVVVAILMLR